MHFHNSALHYFYNMTDGLANYAKPRAFKAKAGQSQGLKVKAKD